MLTCRYAPPELPPPSDLETRPILKALVRAKGALLHLKGSALSIPNQGILIDTLALQEAQASSEIENIVTTQDDLFKGDLFPDHAAGAAKEVARYRDALRLGHMRMNASGQLITNGTLIDMFRLLKQRQDGFRTLPGTALRNEQTGETVFVPPQDGQDVIRLMSALERFVNDDGQSDLDPLIKMAVIHHQFESIHPFPDGNGRIGRILNVLYLTRTGQLDTPILYLSRYINKTKSEYYRLLQAVRDEGAWEDWVVYILTAVAETSVITQQLLEGIRSQMADYKRRMRTDHPKIYSQDLLNNLFKHPYTRIEYVMQDLGVSRPTATRYLERLTDEGFVEKHQSWRDNYYINVRLVRLFAQNQ
jgi:Fic family protein